MTWWRVRGIKIDDVKTLTSAKVSGESSCALLIRAELPYEARTMSLPHGEIEAEPTGLSKRNDTFSPKVRLPKAEVGPLDTVTFSI